VLVVGDEHPTQADGEIEMVDVVSSFGPGVDGSDDIPATIG
jgi:hypothetical protein